MGIRSYYRNLGASLVAQQTFGISFSTSTLRNNLERKGKWDDFYPDAAHSLTVVELALLPSCCALTAKKESILFYSRGAVFLEGELVLEDPSIFVCAKNQFVPAATDEEDEAFPSRTSASCCWNG